MSQNSLRRTPATNASQHQTSWKTISRKLGLLAVIFLAIQMLLNSSLAIANENAQIQSYGAISYPARNVNLAVIPKDWWLTFGPGPQIIYLDYSVIRTLGNPSIRLEPHTANDVNVARECDGTWYPTKPGDHIVAKCWIKTDSSTLAENADPYHGGRIGIDLYGPKGDGTITILDGYPHGGQEHLDSMVHWNTSVWTLRTWDIIIPSTVYTKDVTGRTIPPTPITQFVLWMQAMQVNDGTARGNVWFADAELYINPV